MRVVQAHQFGPPEVLKVEEKEEPQARPGQVVIAVEAAGAGFGDTIIRSGKYPFPLPFVPGWEVGGRVIKVGQGVDQSLIGKLVLARSTDGGGYAEQVAVDATNIFHIPAGLPIDQAVGVFLAGHTAVSLLKLVHVKPDDAVLITAAAGSVGSQLVQQVKAAGAGTVIGAARGKAKLDVISQLGSDIVVDYSEDNWIEQVREATEGKGVDIVLESVGGVVGRQAFEITANGGGRLAVYGTSAGTGVTLDTRELGQRGITVIGALGMMLTIPEQEMRANVKYALTEAVAGRLKAVIERTYPLERAAEAHADLEARRTVGKVLLIP